MGMDTYQRSDVALKASENAILQTISDRINALRIAVNQGAAVAGLAASADLGLTAPVAVTDTLSSPDASALAVDAPVAATVGAAFDQAELLAAFLAKADQAAVSALVDALKVEMDAKADQADVLAIVTALVTAVNLKTDDTAALAMMGAIETRLDALEAKVNEALTSLRASEQIAAT